MYFRPCLQLLQSVFDIKIVFLKRIFLVCDVVNVFIVAATVAVVAVVDVVVVDIDVDIAAAIFAAVVVFYIGKKIWLIIIMSRNFYLAPSSYHYLSVSQENIEVRIAFL